MTTHQAGPTQTLDNDELLTDDQIAAEEYEELSDFLSDRVPLLLLVRPDLYPPWREILDPRIFSKHVPALVIAAIRDLYDEHDVVPTSDAVRDAILKDHTVADAELGFELHDYLAQGVDPRDLPIVKTRFRDWATGQVLTGDFYASVMESVEKGDDPSDVLRETLGNIEAITQDEREQPRSLFDIEMPKHSRVYTSPWDVVNQEIDGIKCGEVVSLTGPTGTGKSLFLDEIMADQLAKGQNVFRIDFENDPDDCVINLALGVVKTELENLTLEGAKNLLQKRVDKGELGQPYYWHPKRRSLSTKDIQEQIEAVEAATGLHFPVLVIDYHDKIKDRKLEKEFGIYQAQEINLQDLQNYCYGTGRVYYTAYQTNRSGSGSQSRGERVTQEQVGGAFAKIQLSQHHLIIEKKANNTSTLHIDKCRRAGNLNGGTISIEYQYHHVRRKGGNRGFLSLRGTRNSSPSGVWADKKAALLDGVKDKDVKRVDGLTIDGTNGKYAGHIGIQIGKLQEYLGGDGAAVLYALQELKRGGRIKEMYEHKSAVNPKETKIRFAGNSGRWIIFT